MFTTTSSNELIINAVPTQCYHCGNDCPDTHLKKDDHLFCCDGCQTVYSILHENNMDYYYSLEHNPGKQALNPADADKYAYLDNEAIKKELLDFYENGVGRITFTIPQIHCSSCIWLLENLHKLQKGIKNSMVNFVKKEASLTFLESEISLRKVVELLAAIGYEPNINLASSKQEKARKPTVNRSLYYKIGIAGFCFGNAMLLSFPDYLAISPESVEAYQYIFNYINFVLALPIVFYCSTDYFVAAYKNLKHKVISIDVPLALGIVVIFGWSSYEIFSHTGTGYMDSLAGLLFFLLTGRWYQQKTYDMLSFDRDYQSYFPIAVTKLDTINHVENSVLIKDIQLHDVIKIRSNELIPADAELLEGDAQIDYSFVTGESNLVSKQRGERIYAGGRQMGSSLIMKVLKPVSQSYLTQLWNQQAFHKDSSLHLSSIINKISTRFTIAILSISLLTGIYWYIQDSSQLALAVTSVLIVACPCALALSLPYAFGSALRLYGQQGFYLKNTEVIENMTKIDTIVFDKTGTLSHNKSAQVEWVGSALSPLQKEYIQTLVQHSTHPLSQFIHQHLVIKSNKECTDFKEIANQGIQGTVDNQALKIGSASFVQAQNPNDTLASYVFISINHLVVGYFKIIKQYREGLETVLAELQKEYQIYLLSGDNDAEKQTLLPLFKDEKHLLFNQSPTSKLEFIRSLQEQGKSVLMVGDGLNDAGALQQSNVGIAISEDINNFVPASDAILNAQQFERLPYFLHYSKTSMKILRTSFLLSLTYNVVGVSFAVRGLLTPLIAAILMPLSSVTVVGFVTLATIFSFKGKQ